MRSLLKFFSSLRNAIILISILAVLSVFGTLIPQMQEASLYLSRFPKYGHLILALGFDDLYHGTLFQLCLWLLSISTLVCTIIRLKFTYRKFFKRLEYVTLSEIKALKVKKVLTNFNHSILNNIKEHKKINDNTEIYFKANGKVALIGGLFIHVGFLILLAGGLIGMLYSAEMTINARQGDIVPIPPVKAIKSAMLSDNLARKGRNIRQFNPQDSRLEPLRKQIDKLRQEYINGQKQPQFKIKINKLYVDYYKNKKGDIQGIKGWHTNLSFIKNNKVEAKAELSVNHPFTFNDVTFYQASWNKIYTKVKFKVSINPKISNETLKKLYINKQEFPKYLTLTVGEKFKPNWSPYYLLLENFMPDFRVMGGRFISISNELNNPAGQLIAINDKNEIKGKAWAFSSKMPAMHSNISNMPFTFVCENALPSYETGLQAAYDPGKPFVWLGSFIFTLGLFLTFYIPYLEEWYILEKNKLTIALNSNQSEDMLKEQIEALAEKFNEKTEKQNNE